LFPQPTPTVRDSTTVVKILTLTRRPT
jgi:hypothetical protein